MKLYAKVALGVVLAFTLMFVTMGILKRSYIDPEREQMLREASAAGLALAAREVAAAADRDAALQRLRLAFALPLELAPRATLPGSGWFVRAGEMYTFREVDARHILVLGPFPDIDGASALMGTLVIVLSLFLAGVVAYWLVAPLARRIRALATTTLRLANRDFAARSSDGGNDVLGDLARRFNDMAAQIESLLETKQQLLQAVSHEFRTPLSRIRFELALLAESTSESERARRFDAIDESLVEMDDLLGELLAYVQVEGRRQLPVETLSPAALAGEVARAIQPLRADIAVRVEARAEMTFEANPKYLRRALQNLVVNAIRHARSEVVIEVDDRAGELVVTVCDDGSGIPEVARERIFEPFVRLDESRNRDEGGAGLGLAIVRKVCEWHGGTVVAATAERGAQFVMTLPRIDTIRSAG